MVLAQPKLNTIDDCIQAKEIIIDFEGGIVLLSNNDFLLTDNSENLVVYYPEKENHQGITAAKEQSIWYKIDVWNDCEITFNIIPQQPTDRYNFFFYKHPGNGSFCEDVIPKKIIPIRANLLKDNTGKEGTGLSDNFGYSDTTDNRKVFYHTAYHHPVHAKMGDVFYLNVHHMHGDDCGHFFKLNVNSNSKSFRAAHRTCFTEPLTKIKAKIPVIKPDTIKKIKRENPTLTSTLQLSGTVTDSIKKSTLQAEITWKQGKNEKEFSAKTNESGHYSAFMMGQMFYEITCTAVGYKSKTFKLMKQTFGTESRQIDFQLVPLKAGEHFVLRNIYFHGGTYAFKTESYYELQNLLNFLKINEKSKIEIQGHTNGKGNIKRKSSRAHLGEEWNFQGNEKKLSKLRAEAVKRYLIKQGIEETRLTAKGLGDQQMLYSHPKNRYQKDMNKRVEIVLLSTGSSESAAENQ
ncbi:MAG: hypothetical protein COA57_04245 [Flavobacteriales bacterium]|nr:MAG: hypothetical protein COA57_04245 [Flavobacteriales bacterium]